MTTYLLPDECLERCARAEDERRVSAVRADALTVRRLEPGQKLCAAYAPHAKPHEPARLDDIGSDRDLRRRDVDGQRELGLENFTGCAR